MRYLLDGRPVADVPPYRRSVNTVFQHYALFPHMDVASNVGYGLRQRKPKPSRQEQALRIGEALELVRLTGYERRRSWELSGGQQQRVALARALINRPTVLLLDEPLGALDLKLRREMQLELKQLQEQLGITFIFVTHDQDEAFSMADRVAVMRDGRILQDGPPDVLYDRPVDPWVAGFIGQMNLFPGTVQDVGTHDVVRLERGPCSPACRRETRSSSAIGRSSRCVRNASGCAPQATQVWPPSPSASMSRASVAVSCGPYSWATASNTSWTHQRLAPCSSRHPTPRPRLDSRRWHQGRRW